jgi:hypothetical protein
MLIFNHAKHFGLHTVAHGMKKEMQPAALPRGEKLN